MNKRKKTEILLLIISLLLLAASGFFLRKYYPLLPDTVPVHFGANGEPDRWGGKESFLGVYVLQIVLNAVMCITQILLVRDKLKGSMAQDRGSAPGSNSPILYNGGLLVALVNVYINVIFGWIFTASVLFGKMGKLFIVVILCGMAGIFLFCFLWRGKLKLEDAEIMKRKTEISMPDDNRELIYEKIRFQGKIDIWFYVVVLAVNGFEMAMLYVCRNERAGIAIILISLALVDLLILPMLFRNYVYLTEKSVQVFFGFIRMEIPYYDITQFYPTHNPLSSLAASLDRIYIGGKMSKDVLIAVREKEIFLKELEKRSGIMPGKKAV